MHNKIIINKLKLFTNKYNFALFEIKHVTVKAFNRQTNYFFNIQFNYFIFNSTFIMHAHFIFF